MISEKDQIRQNILRRRALLSQTERFEKSRSICHILEDEIARKYPQHARILFFASKEDEVDIMPLFDILTQKLHAMYHAFFPKITNAAEGEFAAFPARARGDLRVSHEHFGIHEPLSDIAINPQEIDLVLAPTVALDKEGNRIGYGKGFYDRFLQKVRSDCQKWAVLFSCQKVAKISTEPHDVSVDFLVNENGFFSCKNEL